MAELGAAPACGETHKHPNRRRIGRLCVWSLVIAAAVTVVVNLTVARLPTMPSADGKYISLRGKEIHYVEQPGQGPPKTLEVSAYSNSGSAVGARLVLTGRGTTQATPSGGAGARHARWSLHTSTVRRSPCQGRRPALVDIGLGYRRVLAL
jgi:hypothetical protein